MNKFNNRIYLLLILDDRELLHYYLRTVALVVAIAAYNLIGVFVGTPIVISYYSLIVAFVLLTVAFVYLKTQSLPIDWELLAHLEEEAKKTPVVPPPLVVTDEVGQVEEESAPAVEEVSNEEIRQMEPEDDEFDFTDKLSSLYKTGTPKQLADVAVNGQEQKVRRMNIR